MLFYVSFEVYNILMRPIFVRIPKISKIFYPKMMIEIGLLNEWYTDIAVQNS